MTSQKVYDNNAEERERIKAAALAKIAAILEDDFIMEKLWTPEDKILFLRLVVKECETRIEMIEQHIKS